MDNGTIVGVAEDVEAELGVFARKGASKPAIAFGLVGKAQAEPPTQSNNVKGRMHIVGYKAGDEPVLSEIFVPSVNVQKPIVIACAQFLVDNSYHDLPSCLSFVATVTVTVMVTVIVIFIVIVIVIVIV
eukprot:CAMPEP_0168180744 /NCGR_PEP_ID=MMETSP0139_2-20121125/10737_1 /TAXON_ID=44445 /ORGANISM="Pseudo-nitzschia australis, Strain 10249 10 AB" /LENGTH=128 /DNA_ID=CAMNT_0008101055 /DNA_START=166 /DNA_END=549 /DNA_ORIENTATION=+